MGNFEVLDLSCSERWLYFFKQLPFDIQDVYYTPEYYELYENYGDGKAQCFVFEKNGNIAIYPFLINSVNDLGYDLREDYFDIQGAYGYNGVIANSFDENFVDQFYKTFDKYCKEKNIIAEFTRFHPLLENIRFSETHMSTLFDRHTVYIQLKERSYNEIFNCFQTSTKKQIKRARQRHNINVVIDNKSTVRLDTFFEIYHEAMHRVGSSSYLFFNRDYFAQLLLNTESTIFTAYYNDIPIASIITFDGSKFIHGHLGGAKNDYLHLSASSLLYDEIIKYGLKKNMHYLHFGGGASNNHNDTLLNFKLNFSQTKGNFFIGKKIHYQNVYDDVVRQWEKKIGLNNSLFKNQLLKYRILV